MSLTRMRIPRMQGRPPHCLGFIVIRLRCDIDLPIVARTAHNTNSLGAAQFPHVPVDAVVMADSNCQIANTIPVLAVGDLAASIRFYQSLGFKIDWEARDIIASVSRDGHPIMLQRRDPPTPAWVWIGCSSVASLWEDVRRRGDIDVVQRPTNQPWALEMKIHDPDKNVLWFGSDSLADVPLGEEPAYPVNNPNTRAMRS